MVIALLQILLLGGAGVLLFGLWRVASPREAWLRLIVAGGFLARALIGQALFWISWAGLPLASSLQIGNGLWFFAQDAAIYTRAAASAAHRGPWAIVTYDATAPSVAYIKALALTMWLTGATTSAALLLNLFCYLGVIAIILRLAAPRLRRAAVFAIVALTFSPSFLLWSLQPLKDTFFQFLFVVFVAGCAVWARAWITGDVLGRHGIGAAALMIASLYLLAGIRWYFAFAALCAALLFLLGTVARASHRRLAAAGASLVVLIALRAALVTGAGPYVPKNVRPVLSPFESASASSAPQTLAGEVVAVREGFDRTPARTTIRPGESLGGSPGAGASAPSTAASPGGESTSLEAPGPAPPPRGNPHVTRLLAGTAALLVPNFLAGPLGLFDVGGGRGLLWFTDLDTLVFDAALVFAILSVVAAGAGSLRRPLLWLVAPLTIVLGGLLAYSVTNVGTLFRLRAMVYTGIVLIPLAAARSEPS